MTATPAVITRTVTARKITAADAERRYLAARRRDAARNGYRGPLTRAEAAAQAARAGR
jgi:hypothetical protein